MSNSSCFSEAIYEINFHFTYECYYHIKLCKQIKCFLDFHILIGFHDQNFELFVETRSTEKREKNKDQKKVGILFNH